MRKNILGKVNSSANKILAFLMLAVVAVQNVFAASVVTLPTTAKEDLSDTITTNFPTVIGVIVIMIAVSILIKIIRKAG